MANNSSEHRPHGENTQSQEPISKLGDGLLTELEFESLRQMLADKSPYIADRLRDLEKDISSETSAQTKEFKQFLERDMSSESAQMLNYFNQYAGTNIDIGQIHQKLKTLGLIRHTSSTYDSETFRGIIKYQEKHNLDVNGLPTDETMFKLFSPESSNEKITPREYAQINKVPEKWWGVLEDFFKKCPKEYKERITAKTVIAIASKKSGKGLFIAGEGGKDNFEFRIRLGVNGSTTGKTKTKDKLTPSNRVLRCTHAKVASSPYGRAANSKNNTSVRGASWQGPQMSSMGGRWWHGVSQSRERNWKNDTHGCVGMKCVHAQKGGRIINKKKGAYLYLSEFVGVGAKHNLKQHQTPTIPDHMTQREKPEGPIRSWSDLQDQLAYAYSENPDFDVAEFIESRIGSLTPQAQQNMFQELAQNTKGADMDLDTFSPKNVMIQLLARLTCMLKAPQLDYKRPVDGVIRSSQEPEAFYQLMRIAHGEIHSEPSPTPRQPETTGQDERMSGIDIWKTTLGYLPSGYENMDLISIADAIIESHAGDQEDPNKFRTYMKELGHNLTLSYFIQSHIDSLSHSQKHNLYVDLGRVMGGKKFDFGKFHKYALSYQALIYLAGDLYPEEFEIGTVTMDGVIESSQAQKYASMLDQIFAHVRTNPILPGNVAQTHPKQEAYRPQDPQVHESAQASDKLSTKNFDHLNEYLSENAIEKLITYSQAEALIQSSNPKLIENGKRIIYKIRPESIPASAHKIHSERGVNLYMENSNPHYEHPNSMKDAKVRAQVLGPNGKQYIAVHRTAMRSDLLAFRGMMHKGLFPYLVGRNACIIQGPNEMYTGASINTFNSDKNISHIYGNGINHHGIAIEACLNMTEHPSDEQTLAIADLLTHIGQKHAIPQSRWITSGNLLQDRNGNFMAGSTIHRDDYSDRLKRAFGMNTTREIMDLIYSGKFIYRTDQPQLGYPDIPHQASQRPPSNGIEVASIGDITYETQLRPNEPTDSLFPNNWQPSPNTGVPARPKPTPQRNIVFEKVTHSGHTFDVVPRTHPLISQHDIASMILEFEGDSGKHRDNIGTDMGGGINSGSIEGKWALGKYINGVPAGMGRGPVEKMCQARIATAIKTCDTGAPRIDFHTLPIFVQKVLVDTCYNMAGGKGPTKEKWPTFWSKIKSGLWNEAGLALLSGSQQGGTSKYANDVYARSYANARILQTGKHDIGSVRKYKSEGAKLYGRRSTKAEGLREGYKNLMANYKDTPRNYEQRTSTSPHLTATTYPIDRLPPRAQKLGDFAQNNYKRYASGTNSCGKTVGKILNAFGITGLPTSGRHGREWNDFLDVRSHQFIKVQVNTPNEAKPGAILCYEGGGGGSRSVAARTYGHVEIKGSDNRYYHYKGSSKWGGSAGENLKDSKFVGYAYYPL